MAPRKASRSQFSPSPSTPGPTTTISPPSVSKPATTPAQAAQLKTRQKAGTWAGSFEDLWQSYTENTPKKLKLLDGFQLFLMLSGIAQFIYCVLITNYPFNAFLGGFAATVGEFVLAASLRAQVNPNNKGVFRNISPERAFGDFVGASLLLHFFVFNYLG